MAVKDYNQEKIRIILSNTESVTNNIYKYNNLKKEKKYSNTASTAAYFLTTKPSDGEELFRILNCDNAKFICDVSKTKQCILEQEKILKTLRNEDFTGELRSFYDSKNFFKTTNEMYLELDKCESYRDGNDRYTIHFKNDLENVKNFRNSIVAVVCDLVIEPKGTYNIIYPVLKEPTPKALLKERFLNWLQETKELSEASIQQYEKALDETNLDAIDENIIEKSLYEVLSYDELVIMKNNIFNSQTFIQKRNNRNNVNSAALNHYSDFINEYYRNNNEEVENLIEDTLNNYDQIFLDDDKINEIMEILELKKNIILQGPPGVGKTFIATKLIEGRSDFEDIELIQFHQSYSYEDFIQGYRPQEDGTFKRQNGIFYNLVEKAKANEDKKYCLIIDEINRGNISKIFGELMMLIEFNKRGPKHQVSLTYSKENEAKFYVPENLYIIGTMNTADRSLTTIDYALKRRFSQIDIEPAFNNKKFKKFMIEEKRIDEYFVDAIIKSMNSLNEKITESLSEDFKIGHSYFVGTLDKNNLAKSYNRIKKYEIIPLLKDYWLNDEKILNEDILPLINLEDNYE